MSSLLQIRDVSLTYASEYGQVEALRDIDLTVFEGDSVALIGPSGCGKSSLLKIACGLLRPTFGEVCDHGHPYDRPRADASFIPQDGGLLPWKRVFENVEVGLRVQHVNKAERSSRARIALDAVRMSEFSSSFPSALSGGMRQRVALARAIAAHSRLLLMDEPLSALDAFSREEAQSMLMDTWRGSDYAQLIVTHSIEEAVFMGKRIVVMSSNPGEIFAEIANPCADDSFARSSYEFHEMTDLVRETLSRAMADEGRDDA